MTNEIELHNQDTARAAVRTAIELTADQTEFTPNQVAALKQLGIDDAPAAQLNLFFHYCQRTQLDPFAKQIYLLGRKTRTGGYRGEPERWETKWTIQTGIDGYRLNGTRAARNYQDTLTYEGPYWHDGNTWTDVWLGGQKPPIAAKYIIIVNGQAHTGIAMYDEFVQTKTGGGPNSMWAKMPANQLGKCAEAQAWRRAYPFDFSGLHLEDAALIIDEDGSPVKPAQAERVTATALPAAAGPAVQQWQPAPDSTHTSPAEPAPPPIGKEQSKMLGGLLRDIGLTDPEPGLAYITDVIGREINATAELTAHEADTVIAALHASVTGETTNTKE